MNTSINVERKPLKQFNKMLITTAVITSLASTSISAFAKDINEKELIAQKQQENTNKENIGFGTGALIGGVAAGPLGAIVAGVGGVLIAKFMNVNDENEALSVALSKEKETSQLANKNMQEQYQAKIEQLASTYQQQLVAIENEQQKTGQIQADNLLMSLQFSTGSSDIAPHYQDQISALAKILKSSPNMKIDLSGYTDLTGEEALNQTLSKARVESVKANLIANGVNEQQIALFAFGEGSPVVANIEQEVSFYDRRVVLKLHNPVHKATDQMANNN